MQTPAYQGGVNPDADAVQRLNSLTKKGWDAQLGDRIVLCINYAGSPASVAALANYPRGTICRDTTNGAFYIKSAEYGTSTWAAIGTVVGLTASAAELNTLTGITAVVAELNALADMPATVSIVTTPASGSCAVQCTFKDSAGATLSHAVNLAAYSSASNGLTNVAITSLAVATNGAVLVLAATGAWQVTTTAAGLLGFTLTATAGTYYITFRLPNGKLLTTGAIVVNS